MSDGVRKMTYQLGKAHGWLKRHTVQEMYEKGYGHGMGEANPDPDIQAMVSAAFADDFYKGFADGVKAYEATLL